MTESRVVGDIRQKLKQAKFRHLKRHIEDGLRIRASNCTHNINAIAFGHEIGLCKLKHIVCDPHASQDYSTSCDMYSCRNEKDTLRDEFRDLVEGPLPDLASRYPDLAALRWVLDEPIGEDFHPGTTLVGMLRGIPIWADDEQSAQSAKHDIDTMVHVMSEVHAVSAQLEEFDKRLTGLQHVLEASFVRVGDIESRISDIDAAVAEVIDITRDSRSLAVVQDKRGVTVRFMDWVRAWL